jgi:hypothetical protein
MPIIPALGRLRQEAHDEFQASLSYIARLCSKKEKKKKCTMKTDW